MFSNISESAPSWRLRIAASISRFTPFVESVRWDQAATLEERSAVRRCFIDGLSSGVDGPISDLWVFGPIGNESPLQGVERMLLTFRVILSDRELEVLQLFGKGHSTKIDFQRLST